MASARLDRRSFLRATGGAGVIGIAACGRVERALAASESVAGRSPEEVAKDDFYWRQIQMDFELDRTLINLNNGYTCPTSRMALESEMRYLRMINMTPIFYEFQIADRIETIRLRMAAEFGCEPEEMALTRGASESLQIAQNGIDLKPGDEVVTTEQDYPRMLTTWDQRMRRDGIKVHRLQFPAGDDGFAERIAPQAGIRLAGLEKADAGLIAGRRKRRRECLQHVHLRSVPGGSKRGVVRRVRRARGRRFAGGRCDGIAGGRFVAKRQFDACGFDGQFPFSQEP